MVNSEQTCNSGGHKAAGANDVALALFMDLPNVLYWVLDDKGMFVEVNQAMADHWGGGKIESLIGLSAWHVFSPDFTMFVKRGELGEVPEWGKPELVSNGKGEVEWRALNLLAIKNERGEKVATAYLCRLLKQREGYPLSSENHEVWSIVGVIYRCINRDVRVTEIAEAANISVSSLERIFKEYMHTTPKRFILQAKISAACEKLIKTDLGIKEIAKGLAFSDHASFTRCFSKMVGQSPRGYRNMFRLEEAGTGKT